MIDDTLLDDPQRLDAIDGARLLRAAAAAGAQVRATAEAVAESGATELSGTRPRALVLLGRPGSGTRMMALLRSLLPSSCPVPVVTTDVLPIWVGPLDVVYAHGDDPGDAVLADSVALAGRRGARTLLTAEAEGPVAAAAAGSAWLLQPRVPVPQGFGFARALTAGLLLARMLELCRVDTDRLADTLDEEAARCHPARETFVNPAKSLALRLAGRTPLLWGVDPISVEVARYGARALAAHAGLVCDAEALTEVATRPALRRAATAAASGDDIFADPGDPDNPLLRVVLLEVLGEAAGGLEPARSWLPGADILALGAELGAGGEDAAICAAATCLRFEICSLYLGLASGMAGDVGVAPTVTA